MKIPNLILFIALFLFQLMNAQTYELHNSINFNNVNDARDLPDGITWYKPSPLNYGIFRTSGAWTAPTYQQLKLAFDTGIIIDGGSVHGKSGTILQPNGGNVGIGTSTPNAKVDISDFTAGIGTAVMLGIGERGYKSSSYGFRFKTDNSTGLLSIFGVNAEVETTSLFNLSRATGNVGIGTTNPTSKLTVAGNIASREVKVTVNAGADFVFENGYNLPTLDSVDKYIKENKHLPEIASEKEMQTNGLNLSEMNIKLLQKVEELTLYMIEQNKRLEFQQKENAIQSKQIAEQNNKILKLQEKMDNLK